MVILPRMEQVLGIDRNESETWRRLLRLREFSQGLAKLEHTRVVHHTIAKEGLTIGMDDRSEGVKEDGEARDIGGREWQQARFQLLRRQEHLPSSDEPLTILQSRLGMKISFIGIIVIRINVE